MHLNNPTLSRPRLLFVLAAVTALTLSVRAQQAGQPAPVLPDRQMPPVTFRVEINYVEVDAVVVDKQGRFVGGLQAGDFQVLEDGTPQKLANFGLVEIPIERPETPLFVRQPIEPDVQSNVRPFDGRVYLIVLDELHTEPLHTNRVRAAATRFIQNSLGANDVAAVVSVQGPAIQDFTANKRLLLAAVGRFMGRALPTATQNRIDSYNRSRAFGLPTDTARDGDDMQRSYNATMTLRSLRQLSDFMSGVRGRRKALVLFSEGIDYDVLDFINNKGTSDVIQETREAIGSATRANVSIYTVDPRGLTTLAGTEASFAGGPIGADPALKLGSLAMQDEMRVQHDSLRVLAEETGGFAVLNSNDFVTAFQRIQQDNSSYYVLGYYPANERRDGGFRKIEVKVNRPGLEVRNRRGYLAPRGRLPAAKPVTTKEGTPPVLREVLGSPLPVPGLRLTVGAVPFKGTPPNAAVSFVLYSDARDLAFNLKDGKYEAALDLAVIALDANGEAKGGLSHSLFMPLQPATYQQVLRSGLRVTSRLDLLPGRYQLRVAALDPGSKRTGSVYYDLEVPDFTAEPLMVSGLLLTSARAADAPTVPGTPGDALLKALPGPPTVSREFPSREELAVLAEIYDNETKTPHTVDITATLRADDGREVFKHEDQRSSTELGGERGGYGYTARVPLKGLSPGLYVLKVEARSRLGKGTTAMREVQIRVTQ